MTPSSPPVANHHAGHPAFAGVTGLLAGLSMLVRRRATADLAADLTELSSDDLVVDVGCGPGTAVRHAARLGARATGVDPAPVMLTLARVLTRERPAVTWTEGCAESLPLPDASATVVWSLSTIHHWADVGVGLAEVRRVLTRGGRFLGVERRVRPGATGHASHGWTDEQAEVFARDCTSAGFSEVRVERHRPGGRSVLAVSATRGEES